MSDVSPNRTSSVFRTEAWTQAWLDTWGKNLSSELIDLGGRGKPLEMLYRVNHRFKGMLPASVLCLVGNGFGLLSTPRAEYNSISELIRVAGDVNTLEKELAKLPWQHLHLPDIAEGTMEDRETRSLLDSRRWGGYLAKSEESYFIGCVDFDEYLAGLSTSTRLAFFNRRSRLAQAGRIERQNYALEELELFFSFLNDFHIHRWGKPCYSRESIAFLRNFCERLGSDGGQAICEVIRASH